MRTGRAGILLLALFSGTLAVPRIDQVAAAGPTVVLNELHYHDPDDNPASDYIELRNASTSSQSISGWCLDGVGFCFGSGTTLAPGAVIAIPGSWFSGSLSNGGERIRLMNGAVVVDQVTYDDSGLWPALADGEGLSLERRDPSQPGDDPGNWSPAFPTRGLPNRTLAKGMANYFRNVQHTVLPAAGAPIVVSAELVRGRSAELFYRIGFGPEVRLVMQPDGSGRLTASIPGQAAGALVRYRLVDTSRPDAQRRTEAVGERAIWPRSGDGSYYTGTTVATPTTSKLPRFEWFMEDATYLQAYNDLTLTGDNGYPAVFAYNGVIFDNARVRVKGQVSRSFKKKKWKFILPAGYELAIPGVLPVAVDEFALHSSWNEKSFIRETLAAEMMTLAGVPTSQAFPVRVERNGSFYGLYTYIEQQDGSWRERYGFDEGHDVYEVGGGRAFGLLAAGDATLSQTSFRQKYEKETREWEGDGPLRTLISVMNSSSAPNKKAWIYANVDVPSVVNALAMGIILQHHDWGHKNYRMVRTPQGKWQIVPTDLDLTLGRKPTFTQGPFTDTVVVKDPFEHPGTPLFNPFWFDAELDSLVDRRVRSLSEQLLDPAWIEGRIAALNDLIREEAALDRQVWGTYGEYQVAETAGNEINGAYVAQRRLQIQGRFAVSGRVATTPNTALPDVRITSIYAVSTPTNPEYVVVKNFTNTTVDLSGYRVDAVGLVVPGGTVLRPGVSAIFFTDTAGSLVGKFTCCMYGGVYPGDIADAGELLQLANPFGDVVSSFRYGPAPTAPPLLDLVINEVAPVGDASFTDEATEQEPWFELYNRAPTTANLAGMRIDGANSVTWTIPSGVTLAPGAHLLVVADGETGATHRHAPVLLAAAGGSLVLRDTAGAALDTMAYGTVTFARTPSGGAVAEDVAVATPGAANPLPRARVVLNEVNGVADNKTLKNGGSDPYWGQVLGNGGDWFELVVVTDHVDLRGWQLDVIDNAAAAVTLTMPADAGLADVRAGTIVTIAENPAAVTDYTVDHDNGDHWININLTGFNTSNNDTQVTIRDAGGRVVFGPAGEGANPLEGGGGLGSDEALQLNVSPTFATLAAGPYLDVSSSSFGVPNTTMAGVQDFAPLRDTSRPGTPRLIGFDGLAPVISWTPPVGALATGYLVRRDGVQIGTTAGTGYRDTTAPQGRSVVYEIVAQLALGGTSAPSGPLSVQTTDDTAPVLAPGIIPFNVSKNSMRIYWNWATDNVGIAQYRVFVNGRLAATTNGSTNFVDFTQLPDPVPVYFEVFAVDTAGLRSATVASLQWTTGDGTGPGPVRSVSSSSTRNGASMQWGFAADVSGVSSYRVTRVDNGQVINTTGHSATFGLLTPGTWYKFHIQAIDSKGNLGLPAVVIVATKP